MNVQIHKISADVVRTAPTFFELWPEIRDYIGKAVIVAHSAGFDMSVLRSTLDAYRLEQPPWEFFCTVTLAKAVWGFPSNTLPNLAASLGIEHTHHEALSDAMTCASILLKALEHTSSQAVDELLRKHQMSLQLLNAINV